MTQKNGRSITLCLLCQNFASGCNWSKYFEAVDGWTAICDYKHGRINHAWVAWCPKFKADKGIYDLMVKGNPQKCRMRLMEQYGYISELRFITIRYHLVNDYEKGEEDEKRAYNKNAKIPLRQFYAAVKRTMHNTNTR